MKTNQEINDIRKFFCNIKSIIVYSWKIDKRYILLIIASSIITSLINVFNIYILKYLADAIVTNKDKNYIIIIGLMLLVGLIVNLINATASNIVYPLLLNKINKCIQERVYKNSLNYPIQAYDDNNFYDNYFYVLQYSQQTIIQSLNLFGNLLTNILSISGIAMIISNYDSLIIILVLLSVVISSCFSIRNKLIKHNFDVACIPASREINYINRIFYLNDFAKEMKMYKKSDIVWKHYSSLYKKLEDNIKKFGKKIGILSFIENSTNSIFYSIILIYLSHKLINQYITIGEFMVMFNGAQQMFNQIFSIVSVIPQFYTNSLKFDKYTNFMNNASKKKKNLVIIDKIQTLDIKNVSFSYNEKDFILNNINLKVCSRGEKLAIVGSNGSGKSTLIKVILGLYFPQSGRIKVNGINIDDVDIDSYRNRIAVVFQDFKLFAFTIAQNIMMKYDIDNSDIYIVESALKFVGMYEKVKALPNGIYTCISKEFSHEGEIFSGGEMQKLALARAYAQNADLIILDEPYSSFDPIAEDELFRMIFELVKDKTTIVVSHKLLKLFKMDRIIVLDKGFIIEDGNHFDLLKLDGIYKNMYYTQLDNNLSFDKQKLSR